MRSAGMSPDGVAEGPALSRARRLLARPHGWIDPVDGGRYALRAGRDRRARVLMTLDEAAFRRLAEAPGLKARPGGGWVADGRPPGASDPVVGRPGAVEGVRTVMDPQGRLLVKRANLGHSAIAWLASRTGPDGAPWLTPAQVAAAHRLGRDAEAAVRGASVTMRWDALPRTGAGGAVGRTTTGSREAARRVESALAACGPARGLVDAICIRASALQAAEQALGLRRRAGKQLLRAGLSALARHYRIG